MEEEVGCCVLSICVVNVVALYIYLVELELVCHDLKPFRPLLDFRVAHSHFFFKINRRPPTLHQW